MDAAILLTRMADLNSSQSAITTYLTPVLASLAGIASLALTFFLVQGGVLYMTSSGNPESLEHAKKVIKNALIGLVLVIGAGALTLILTHAYHQPAVSPTASLPSLTSVQPKSGGMSIVDVLVKTITGVLNNIIQAVGAPFMHALSYFTTSTPLMGENKTVFTLWLTIMGIADGLFVLVVALLGFRVMSATSLGFEEIEFKHLLPQIGVTFLLMNTSIFIIDAIIGVSNAMIHALQTGFNVPSVWYVLTAIADKADAMGLAAMLIMLVFVVLSVILLVYYVGRLVTLYIGAALSPLIAMLWLLPGFKDFAVNAIKAYLTTVFVLFVHVVVLLLASSIFAGLAVNSPNGVPDPIMALVVGLATVIALLKTQGVMMQLTYASIGPRTLRKLGGEFVNGVSFMSGRTTAAMTRSSRRKSSDDTQDTPPAPRDRARTSTVRAQPVSAPKPSTRSPQDARSVNEPQASHTTKRSKTTKPPVGKDKS